MHQGSHIVAEGSGLSVEAIAASAEATVPHSTWLVRLEDPLGLEHERTAIAVSVARPISHFWGFIDLTEGRRLGARSNRGRLVIARGRGRCLTGDTREDTSNELRCRADWGI